MIRILLTVLGLLAMGVAPVVVACVGVALLSTRAQWRKERPAGYRMLPAVAR